jgi:hypothetical protein
MQLREERSGVTPSELPEVEVEILIELASPEFLKGD